MIRKFDLLVIRRSIPQKEFVLFNTEITLILEIIGFIVYKLVFLNTMGLINSRKPDNSAKTKESRIFLK